MQLRRLVVQLTTLAALCAAVLATPSEAQAVTLHATPGFMRDIDIGANGAVFGIGGKDDAHPGNGWVYKGSGTNWNTRTRAPARTRRSSNMVFV